MQPASNGAREDGGFTLVELAVVLLILGVLGAIALPVFLGSRTRADDLTAERMTVRAVKTARILGTDVGNFSDVTKNSLKKSEPEISWLNKSGKSTNGSEVSQDVPDATAHTFVAAAYSESGTCFFVLYSMTSATQYGTITDTTSKKCYAGNVNKAIFQSSW